jgi:ABC-type amino acid transport substrate-binding protein
MRACLLIVTGCVVLGNTPTAQACGDKFLLVGRGVSFRRAYAAVYPASIVVYAQPQRSAAKAIRDPRLQADLKMAGHRVLVVENDGALARALESDRVDLVLTDVADANRMSKQATESPSKPKVLPVMYEPTKAEEKEIEARYQCRLTSSDRADRYLVTIDNAMKARVDQKKKKSS